MTIDSVRRCCIRIDGFRIPPGRRRWARAEHQRQAAPTHRQQRHPGQRGRHRRRYRGRGDPHDPAGWRCADRVERDPGQPRRQRRRGHLDRRSVSGDRRQRDHAQHDRRRRGRDRHLGGRPSKIARPRIANNAIFENASNLTTPGLTVGGGGLCDRARHRRGAGRLRGLHAAHRRQPDRGEFGRGVRAASRSSTPTPNPRR